MHTLLSQQLASLVGSQASALDRLILHDSAQLIQPSQQGQDILVLDDPTGALTLDALWKVLATGGRVLSRQCSYHLARRLFDTVYSLGKEASSALLLAGLNSTGQVDSSTFALGDFLLAHTFRGNIAIGHLPKSHAGLADTSYDFATYQQAKGTDATLILGGNTKHMVHSFNKTLQQSFAHVHGLRGKGKHRCLLAKEPAATCPKPQLTGALKAFGGVFSGGKPDAGGQLLATSFLADFLAPGGPVDAKRKISILDLGCGNGSVSANILEKLPAGYRLSALYATDLDMDAMRSAAANLSGYPAVHLSWDQGASRLPAASVDIVLLNPPFHRGTTVDLSLVSPLLEAAHRVLVSGGKLYLVHNSHARYRAQVEELFVDTCQLERTPTFTVLGARKK